MDAAVFCRVWAVLTQEIGGNTAPDLFCDVWGAAVAAAGCEMWPRQCSAPGSVCSIPSVLATVVGCFSFSML